jgi:hypothetical protein
MNGVIARGTMCAGEEIENIFTVLLLPAMLRYPPSSLFIKDVTEANTMMS